MRLEEQEAFEAEDKNQLVFGQKARSLTAEQRGQMRQLTMRHLRLEKTTSENTLSRINTDLVG